MTSVTSRGPLAGATVLSRKRGAMASTRQTIIRSDMSRCAPADRLARTPRPGCWTLVDYRTEDGTSGVMAFAHPDDAPGEITLPLEARGRYHVFLGVNYTRTPYADVLHRLEYPLYGQLWVKLSGDPGFCRVAAELMWRHAERFTAKTGREMQMWCAYVAARPGRTPRGHDDTAPGAEV